MDWNKKKKHADREVESAPESNDRVENSSVWVRLKARLQRTELYQVFIVRAMKRRFTKLMYAVAIYSLLMGNLYFTSTWFPPQSFDQLEKTEGKLLRLKKPPRDSLYKMVILQEDGNKILLRVYLNKQEKDFLVNVVGDDLTVYYDHDLHPFYFKLNMVRNVIHEKISIVNYENYERLLNHYLGNKTRTIYYISIALILLSYIYIVNRKSK
ncbi:hypothetical protein [Desulfuromonas sp. AOP6]|uniref:hypothetical protein n=1 Tax=Desulfuromonas sp. AOP6 TaxID=1566351 RepID=UPI001284D6F8|nr:hypothetical protein [Desulfuromonas sp. AOP6]BCA79064.1 hypothetical protein AOP6_0851 [Desulfuromonas sp. AOP6]